MFGKKARTIKELERDLADVEVELNALEGKHDVAMLQVEQLLDVIDECLAQGRYSKGFKDKIQEKVRNIKLEIVE